MCDCGCSYFVHVNRELCKPLPGIFLLYHTGDMQTGCGRKSRTDHVTSDKSYFKSIITLNSCDDKCTGRNLTQGNHEGRVEQTQIRPVCVIHYSPGTERDTE